MIDLERCTRCLECVKACSDSHQGETRLMFEGERFDKYLVPAACRSCHDPLCLVGCPVDAIHRRPPDSRNPDQPPWPYSSRTTASAAACAPTTARSTASRCTTLPHPKGKPVRRVAAPARIATNCDLCESLDGVPRCVYACPHDAATRSSGYDLMASLKLDMLGPAPAAAGYFLIRRRPRKRRLEPIRFLGSRRLFSKPRRKDRTVR